MMIKTLIIVIAVLILMYLLIELFIHYFEVPVLIFKIKQFVAYAIGLCFAGGAVMAYKIKVLMWFCIALSFYWLVKSLIDRSEFYYWLETAENAVNAINEQQNEKGKEE